MADQQSTPQPPEPEPMTRERAIELLKTDVKAWNEWRKENPKEELPDLSDADLFDAILSGADLSSTNLSGAILHYAELSDADLSGANLSGAFLSGAHLMAANLTRATLDSSDFYTATAHDAVFGNLDLSSVRGLESILHTGPSTVGTDTLVRSRGRIPAAFLRGCGLVPWEIEAARLYDPALTPAQINDIQYEIFDLRTGPLFLGGIFISYSHDDAKFVDKLYDRLMAEGANVWLDRHDAVAGRLQDQVDRAIRLNDIVVLVLSKSSVNSDWVKHELKVARRKEKEEGRDVLCPVTLDDAWHARKDDLLWERLTESLILDFSKWKTKAFDAPFGKLIKGLRTNFPRDDPDAPADG